MKSEKASETAANELMSGAILFVIGLAAYWYLWDFENSTETSRRMPSLLVILYDAGGKPLAAGSLLLIGALLIAHGGYATAKLRRTGGSGAGDGGADGAGGAGGGA